MERELCSIIVTCFGKQANVQVPVGSSMMDVQRILEKHFNRPVTARDWFWEEPLPVPIHRPRKIPLKLDPKRVETLQRIALDTKVMRQYLNWKYNDGPTPAFSVAEIRQCQALHIDLMSI